MVALFLRPDADQSDGSWLNESASNTNLFNSVDESSFSDSDFIKSSSTSGDKVRLRLSDPGATVAAPMIMRYRCKKDGGADADVVGRLFQGTAPGTQIATWRQTLTTTFTTYTYTLTTPEFNSISDFNDLYIEFEYSGEWWLSGATIDLSLSQNKYYDSGAGGAGQAVTSYLSCVRASSGYATNADGTLTSFGTDTLRIGVGKGMLVENARTNLCVRSQEFDNASWTKQQCSFTADALTAPDGTSTADVLVEDSSNNTHDFYRFGHTITANATCTLSVYAKAVNRNYCFLFFSDNSFANSIQAVFDLSNGTVNSSAAAGSATLAGTAVEALANGWYRCSATGSVGGGFTTCLVNAGAAAPAQSYLGLNQQAVGLWGIQFEDSSTFVSSYIPTTTGTITRAQDLVTCISNLNTLLTGSAASAVVDCLAGGTPPTNWRIIGIDASQKTALSVVIPVATPTNVGMYNAPPDSSGLDVAITGTYAAGVKVGSAWTAAGGRSVVGGGGTVASDANLTTVTGPTIGSGNGGAPNQWYGYFRRLTFWNSKIADATLQGFTT